MIDNKIKVEYIKLKNDKEYHEAFRISFDALWDMAYDVCVLYECKPKDKSWIQISFSIDALIDEGIIDKKNELFFAMGFDEYILYLSSEEDVLEVLEQIETYIKNLLELYEQKNQLKSQEKEDQNHSLSN